jgi:DNA mismatch repair protein MutL
MNNGPEIRVLDPDVVAQIAAGEVVERPLSVVKELVENSLDAGARRIAVEIQGGGVKGIRVVDDGRGMDPSGARICTERHATSKLRHADDLHSLNTMGFRGEGLFCISAVSRFSLTTRPADVDAGFRLVADGGAVTLAQPVGCRPGTQVEVTDLFFNTPARRKFLKSIATEAAHISDFLIGIAASFFEVHFSLTHDGRQILDLPASADRQSRVRDLLSKRVGQLHRAEILRGDLRVECFLAGEQDALRSARSLLILVNQRVVRDRSILNALLAGYGDRLAKGRYPVGMVYLQLPPSELDVNVHPQKTVLRFADPAALSDAIRCCVQEALSLPGDSVRVYKLAAAARPVSAPEEAPQRLAEATRRFWGGSALPRGSGNKNDAEIEKAGRARLVGRWQDKILICEARGDLYLLDELALDRHLLSLEISEATAAIELDPPLTVQLADEESELLSKRIDSFSRLAFSVQNFGGNSWVLRQVPAVMKWAQPERLLRSSLSADTDEAIVNAWTELLEEPRVVRPELLLAKMAEMGIEVNDLPGMQSMAPGSGSDRGKRLGLSLDRDDLEAHFR